MTKEEANFIGAMNMCDEISNEAYKKIMCHCEEQQPCEDAVSREDLRDAISNLNYWHANQYGELRPGGGGKYATVYKANDVERMADTLPSVTPIRPKGEWETGYTYPDGVYWKCSACKELIRVRIPMHFCSNCGADMRGGKE